MREKQLKTLPEADLTSLRDALSAAAGATDANKTLSVSESEVKRLIREIKDLHKELTGAPEDLDTTASSRFQRSPPSVALAKSWRR